VSHPELARLTEVMGTLRQSCPWDRQQTHRSLVQYLIEETLEVVEAIESGDLVDLREELGDLLLQVVFHAEIASEGTGGFDLEDVAKGIADKLIARHPHVFDAPADAGTADLAQLNTTWEEQKALEKGRLSVLDGIPDQLSALAKANKVISRVRTRHIPLELPAQPIGADEVGAQLLSLVARAQAHGVDPDQAMRDAVRELETSVRRVEAPSATGVPENLDNTLVECEVEGTSSTMESSLCPWPAPPRRPKKSPHSTRLPTAGPPGPV
jgi:XTP/dITP diphosphohydrolase